MSVLDGSASGLTAAGGQLFTQDTAGIPGAAEAEDHFGAALAAGEPDPPPAAAASTRDPRAQKAAASAR